VAAGGYARHRQAIAAVLGVQRHRVAAWFDAYAAGGIDQMLYDEVPRPPLRPRITAAALTALQEALQDPHGFAGYTHIRTWLAEQPHVALSDSGGSALGRPTLGAKPKRPRPSHAQKSRKRPPNSLPHAQPCSSSRARAARQSGR
jgi:hypothetical protein